MTEHDHPFGAEPARDAQLGAWLTDVVGPVPDRAVNWTMLADRISSAVQTPWWSYATRWERRAVPLALAAGLVATIALFGTSPASPAFGTPDTLAAVVTGSTAEDAVSQYMQAMTSTDAEGVPE